MKKLTKITGMLALAGAFFIATPATINAETVTTEDLIVEDVNVNDMEAYRSWYLVSSNWVLMGTDSK